ncbi:hypothetical protein Plhal304r1_c014g0052421 [Plasmopara halstedii]
MVMAYSSGPYLFESIPIMIFQRYIDFFAIMGTTIAVKKALNAAFKMSTSCKTPK